jgi:hypothetical protein
MTVKDVNDWVVNSVKDGARHLHSHIDQQFYWPENRKKVIAFLDACERVQKDGI